MYYKANHSAIQLFHTLNSIYKYSCITRRKSDDSTHVQICTFEYLGYSYIHRLVYYK